MFNLIILYFFIKLIYKNINIIYQFEWTDYIAEYIYN